MRVGNISSSLNNQDELQVAVRFLLLLLDAGSIKCPSMALGWTL